MNYCNQCNEAVRFYLKPHTITTSKLLKYVVVMKLIILLTIVGLQVSAAALGQQVTLSVKSAPLKEVMNELRKQSGYSFFMRAEDTKTANPVTITLKNATIEKTLQTIFASQPLKYEISGKMIILTPKEKVATEQPSILDKLTDFFSAIDVRGKVTDSEGNPLPGASVKSKGKSTVTNSNGEFALNGIDGGSTIEVSYLGYKTASVIARSGSMSIVLESSAADLQIVEINKGYYTTKQELNTGSVGTITAADISKQPVSDLLMALEGRIAGLSVSQTSGIPGASVNVNIRGLNSIANGTNPLYIIDGIPFNSNSLSQSITAAGYQALSPFTSIRPNDIESIAVLKDADATAIYGSRGANGVILITTKKGKIGKTKVDLNVYSGASNATKQLNLMDTKQYFEMRTEAYKNDGIDIPDYDYEINGTWDRNKYTDWQKIMIGGSSKVTDANATISGGNQLLQFTLGASYRRETLLFPGDYNNKIGSGNFNINHQSENGKFKASFSTNYSNNSNHMPISDLASIIFSAPNTPDIYDNNGKINWDNGTFNNPLALTLQKANANSENLKTNLVLSYEIIEGLQLKASGGYNGSQFKEINLIPYASVNPFRGDYPPDVRVNNTGFNSLKSIIIEPEINYHKSFGKHHIDALIASTYQENKQSAILLSATGFNNDLLLENTSAAPYLTSLNTYTQYRYNAVFARIGYDFKEKYILNLTGRRDGSSRFGPGRQFGNFGAIGAAWLFHKETWVSNSIPFLSLGKLRASIGKTGNDQMPDYDYLSYYAIANGYLGVPGLTSPKLTNPFYGWETINKLEAALEIGFFKNRLLLNTNLYRNRTSNQLVGYPLPGITGFPSVRANLPAVIENKGLEFELNTINIEGKSFIWRSSANISFPRNKLLSFPNIKATSYATRYAVGESLNMRYLYHYTGIDRNTGIYTFEDKNKDGTLNTQNDANPVFIGQKFLGGVNNSFSFKAFTLDFFIQFVKQVGRREFGIQPGSFGVNQQVEYLDRWQKAGDDAKYQKFSATNGDVMAAFSRFSASEASVQDASFVRLKNVSFSWTMPQKLTDYLKLKSARLYLQGQNLFTLTKYEGLDPETLTQVFPPLRVMTAGVQISL